MLEIKQGVLEKVKHQCDSRCGNSIDCPLCPHNKLENEFCEVCDRTSPSAPALNLIAGQMEVINQGLRKAFN